MAPDPLGGSPADIVHQRGDVDPVVLGRLDRAGMPTGIRVQRLVVRLSGHEPIVTKSAGVINRADRARGIQQVAGEEPPPRRRAATPSLGKTGAGAKGTGPRSTAVMVGRLGFDRPAGLTMRYSVTRPVSTRLSMAHHQSLPASNRPKVSTIVWVPAG